MSSNNDKSKKNLQGGPEPFRCCLAFVFLIFVKTLVFAQDIDHLHIEQVQEEGLSNNSIMCINQDTNGFLWFGTREGLFRFDGYAYKAFKNFPGDSSTLVNNVIRCLYPDKNKLWIGTFGGLSYLDIESQRIKNFYWNELLQVSAIVPKDDSTLWVGTSKGLFQFNKIKCNWKRAPGLEENIFITSICDDKKKHLYITTKKEFYCYNISNASYQHYRPDLPTYPKINKKFDATFIKSLLARDGTIWMTTWGCGLVQFNPQNGKLKSWCALTANIHALPYKIAFDLLEDGGGNIWFANKEGGLTIFEPAKNRFVNYPIDWKSDNNLSRAVNAVFKDRSDIFWIGTEEGIFKYDPHHTYLSKSDLFLKTGKGLEQSPDVPISLLQDRYGTWWYGTYNGLYTFNEKTGTLNDCNKLFGIPPHSQVFDIIEDADGTIWCNAKNTLVKIVRRKGLQTSQFRVKIFKSPDIKSNLYSLYTDHENRLWIGTHNDGVYRFDQQSEKFISCHYRNLPGTGDKISEIRTFCELSKDSLLFGGEQTGLVLLHTGNGRFEKIRLNNMPAFAADPSINTIYRKGNDLWIGTEFDGLWKTDTGLKSFSIETINDGLPSMNIESIVDDKKDDLWLLTSAGVVELKIPGKKITIFDKRDGISGLGDLSSIAADKQGDISVGGIGSVYKINSSLVTGNKQPPPVFITNLRVFDKEYPINKNQVIKLDYNQNYFSFEYVALNYTQSKLNKYAYKMDGLDNKWNNAGYRRYVSYANLDEGTYTINVKASNNDGVWNNEPAKLTIIISPPFWHRLWFYLLVISVFVGMVYSLYMYNINQLKMRLQLRDKIARDLHDDIGSTLSGINIFSKIVLQKLETDNSGSLELVEKISEKSQNTLEALSDIVWSINTRNDNMDNFLMKANEYLSILDVQGIAYDLRVDPEMENLKIGMILRKELYLIFKEAVCNASKYARCSFIQISLTGNKDSCKLIIQDNGVGFDVNNVSSGNGIYNMQQRAKKINAKFEIESGKNRGTTVTLNFRITQIR